MTNWWHKAVLGLLAGSIPAALFAFSGGPPIRRTGAPVDANGVTCTACHGGTALNSPGGRVAIEAAPYRSGAKQVIRVRVEHADAQRWGFQLTARYVADPTVQAGTFTQTDDIRVQCATGSDGACGGSLEFASHRAASTAPGTPGGKTFEVEWTAPQGAERGDIVFYAAGNAANNSNSPAGDRIYNSSLRIAPDPAACNLTERPQLRTVGNAASFQPQVSANSLITLQGLNFTFQGVQRIAGAGDIRDNKFPTALSCIAVEIMEGGNWVRLPITYVQPDQINAQGPTTRAAGPAQIRVVANPGLPNQLLSDVATVNMLNFSPAFFTFNGRSIAALNAVDNSIVADPAVVAGGRPLRPGDIVSLYATGLGATNPTTAAGDIYTGQALLRDTVSITIGGTTIPAADILYAGGAPGLISGAYQLNVRIPASAGNGDLPVTMTIGGVTSPTGTTIPVRTQP